jgi:predicted acyl esterase
MLYHITTITMMDQTLISVTNSIKQTNQTMHINETSISLIAQPKTVWKIIHALNHWIDNLVTFYNKQEHINEEQSWYLKTVTQCPNWCEYEGWMEIRRANQMRRISLMRTNHTVSMQKWPCKNTLVTPYYSYIELCLFTTSLVICYQTTNSPVKFRHSSNTEYLNRTMNLWSGVFSHIWLNIMAAVSNTPLEPNVLTSWVTFN